MKLTDERLDEIASKILERAGKFPCPICKATVGFTFPEHEFELVSATQDENGIHFQSGMNNYFRVLPLTCDNCGFVVNFNLQKIDKFLKQDKK
ncbi:hypothetical protein [Parabacteroides goldsteinii]